MRFGLPLLASALLAMSANAADCEAFDHNDVTAYVKQHDSDFWALRQRMCGDRPSPCSGTECTLTSNNRDGGNKLYRKDVQYSFPNCWDAIDNIIKQCQRRGFKSGWWQLGDEFYQLWISPDFAFKKREIDNQTETA